jgi:hypothetical protein
MFPASMFGAIRMSASPATGEGAGEADLVLADFALSIGVRSDVKRGVADDDAPGVSRH